MKLKFDANLEYQKDAVNAVVNIFADQPFNESSLSVALAKQDAGTWAERDILGVGNNLIFNEDTLKENVLKIQTENEIEKINELQGLDFSIEMETGTGKTYVYLRTIFELNQKYNFKKFVIVVPSVAIREGTLKNLEITGDHFKRLYNNVPFDFYVYDSNKASTLRQFATSNQIQILIINIDAFRKTLADKDDEKKANVIHRENDKMSGKKPIEFIQAVNPIVIIDEPQSVDSTEKAKEAIMTLNPLCTLRYSATHRNPYNLLYKLDPIKAYDLKLVKKIEVASVVAEDDLNSVFIKFKSVDNKNGIKAKLELFSEGKKKGITVVNNDNLEIKAKNSLYSNNFIVNEISAEPGNEYISFANGVSLNLGEETGGMTDDIMKVQIKNTISEHFEKELRYSKQGIKVLSLFFIDKVSNYRHYDKDGNTQKGKIAKWFEESFKELVSKPRYSQFGSYDLDKIHDGYFAQDKKGKVKDTKGDTKDDDDVYQLIMKDKERLLSMEEPLRFIFSHSALREGWDNPNVFQICTLNETRSEMKKRQEIGRGLRLPVNQQGERVFDEAINRLTVIANESYEDFAKKLQTEMEEDFGIKFGKIDKYAFSKIIKVVDGEDVKIGQEKSEKIWEELKNNNYIDEEGTITGKFDPDNVFFSLEIGYEFADMKEEIVDIMQSFRFSRRIENKNKRKDVKLNKRVYMSPEFKELWDRISQKTTYSVNYETDELIENAAIEVSNMGVIEPVKIKSVKAGFDIKKEGISSQELYNRVNFVENDNPLPDIISYIQKRTELTRRTIAEILKKSGRLDDFTKNPQKFMDEVTKNIKRVLNRIMIKGIKYEKIDDYWVMSRIEEEIDKGMVRYMNKLLEVQRSVYDNIEYDSSTEKEFAKKLDSRDDIKLFMKLPSWFKIETPVGGYNPDWAIVKVDEGEEKLFLIRETKSTKEYEKRRVHENDIIACARAHYEAFEGVVSFEVVTKAEEV
ncbi:MAG TPA: DEAD/DEAH box helicase family protein [bacterium]|nr:DEAD/DEAH box helicase family protein [bacterium]HPV21241.1 DEAD/DEAH box helicase family protein [bacterium]HQM83439.1 DEAD/DEAH box helicase family protein [bacterium]